MVPIDNGRMVKDSVGTGLLPGYVQVFIRVCDYVGWHLPCKLFLQYHLLLSY